MNNETLIKTRISQAIKITPEKINVVKRFAEGRSHFTYLIEIDGQKIVYRIVGENGNLFVERKQEFEFLKQIDNLGITGRTIYFDEKTGDKASLFIEGSTFTNLDFYPHLTEIASTYHSLHKLPITNIKSIGLIERLNLYESYTHLNTPIYSSLKEWWINVYNRQRANQPKVFCHNDAQKANIILNEKGIYLLDFEFAGPNEFYYDIACFGNQNMQDAIDFLDAYLGRKATKEEQDIVKFYRIYQALMWHQVAFKKEQLGLSKELNMDFKLIAMDFLNLANKLYHEIKG